jgi:hypothetical protein
MKNSRVKAMVIVLFDIRGVIIIERVYEGQTVNQEYLYVCSITLREYVCVCVWGGGGLEEMAGIAEEEISDLHQDNAPAHNAIAVKQFLTVKCIPALKHRPRSTDLAPYDFNCCPKWKVR